VHRIVFQSPSGLEIENPEMKQLMGYIIEQFPQYWHQGHGGGIVDFYDGNNRHLRLLILPHDEYGIYLQYVKKGINEETWLSLFDHMKLNTTAECGDELYASIGLFLPKEKAWLAVEEFCKTGERTEKIDWVSPSDIPEGGNW
jgi:hypothetical protein